MGDGWAHLKIWTFQSSLSPPPGLTAAFWGPAMPGMVLMSFKWSWYSSASVSHCCSYAAYTKGQLQRLLVSCGPGRLPTA